MTTTSVKNGGEEWGLPNIGLESQAVQPLAPFDLLGSSAEAAGARAQGVLPCRYTAAQDQALDGPCWSKPPAAEDARAAESAQREDSTGCG